VELDPGQGSLQLAGMGVSKLLTRQARHAFMLMMAGIWTEAIALASLVFDQSRGHTSIKRRYKQKKKGKKKRKNYTHTYSLC
jgi:hypothetical protein